MTLEMLKRGLCAEKDIFINPCILPFGIEKGWQKHDCQKSYIFAIFLYEYFDVDSCFHHEY